MTNKKYKLTRQSYCIYLHEDKNWHSKVLGCAMRKYFFRHMPTVKAQISILASPQSDQCLHSPLTEFLDSAECITKTRLFKYTCIETFTTKKIKFFQIKKILYFFHISAQNIDCGYSLKPPRRGGYNKYPLAMFLNRDKKNNVYRIYHIYSDRQA